MNENSYFNLDRIRLLLFRQLRFNAQTLLIGYGAVAGFIVFVLSIKLVFTQSSLPSGAFLGLAMPFFFAGGYVFTSTIFSELRTPQRGYLLLTLPASTIEKLLVSWFISSIVYIIVSVAVLYLMNFLLIGVYSAVSSNSLPVVNFFEPHMLKMYAIYLVTQPIFILGAIYFRSANFLKTILSLFLLTIIVVIYTSIVSKIIFIQNFQSLNFGNENAISWVNFFGHTFPTIMKVLFWGFLGPFFLLVSYFRLKERQV